MLLLLSTLPDRGGAVVERDEAHSSCVRFGRSSVRDVKGTEDNPRGSKYTAGMGRSLSCASSQFWQRSPVLS